MTMVSNLVKTYQHHNDKHHHHQLPLPKRNFVTYAVYALIAVALLYLFVDPAAPPSPPPAAASSSATATTKQSSLAAAAAARPPWIQQQDDDPPEMLPPAPALSSMPMSPSPSSYQQGRHDDEASPSSCDYSDGEWVPDASPPPYNGTTCGAIRDDGRSCTANGRPDTGYVHWRWRPRGCDLPAFSAAAFLRWLRNRHMAFVGDSLARNQAESLVCLLSSSASSSPPELVHRSAADGGRFRRWVFRDHNATVSIFWSPFLLRGVEKKSSSSSERGGGKYNQLFLDAFDERWMSELAAIDAVVLSAGHWFRIPSVYHDGGRVVGCHGCNDDDDVELNKGTAAGAVAEVSFFAVFRDAVRRTLAEVARRHRQDDDSGGGGGKTTTKLVAMTTFSPSHFEGQWNEGAPCKKKADTELGYTETEMRKIVVEEVQEAAAMAAATATKRRRLRFAAVDVTALANLRPDGHPGPYMRKNPFAGGNGNKVQHDCLHWCMPGPVDTFNQILLQTILRC